MCEQLDGPSSEAVDALPNNDLEQTRRHASKVSGRGERRLRSGSGSWWGVQLKSNSLERAKDRISE